MKYRCLNDFFAENKKVALAFSGGVDSAYLMAEAVRAGVEVRSYFVKSQFQPDFELEDAKKLAKDLGCRMRVIEVDVLSSSVICKNLADRCYHCKNLIFSEIIKAAKDDGFDTVIDGTNASDDASDRPGMRALAEMKVFSPLRLCNMTKAEIREKSKELGLFTWDKPAYACLATRVPEETLIDQEKLRKIEGAENVMMEMGFSDFRVRYFDNFGKIQVKKNQMSMVVESRDELKARIKPFFETLLLDLEER